MSDANSLITRMRKVLGDEGPVLLWTTDQLTEGLSNAYADFRMHAGEALVLNGLHGEANPTNFSSYYFALLVRGALGYALLGRAAERAHAFNFNQDLAGALLGAGRANLEQFEKGLQDLSKMRQKKLQESVDSPYPTGITPGWELD